MECWREWAWTCIHIFTFCLILHWSIIEILLLWLLFDSSVWLLVFFLFFFDCQTFRDTRTWSRYCANNIPLSCPRQCHSRIRYRLSTLKVWVSLYRVKRSVGHCVSWLDEISKRVNERERERRDSENVEETNKSLRYYTRTTTTASRFLIYNIMKSIRYRIICGREKRRISESKTFHLAIPNWITHLDISCLSRLVLLLLFLFHQTIHGWVEIWILLRHLNKGRICQ